MIANREQIFVIIIISRIKSRNYYYTIALVFICSILVFDSTVGDWNTCMEQLDTINRTNDALIANDPVRGLPVNSMFLY